MDNFGWSPAFADYKQILEQLKTDDEMIIYEAMINLSNQLSMAQENTLASFPLDQYIPVLINILKRPPTTDLANEVNINHGAVKSIAEVLERAMGFIDLNDACIKCFEKISTENPYAILTSGSIGLCLNMMDFFEIPTQKKILNMVLNVSRNSATEQDLNDYILPILPFLGQMLQSRGDHALAKIEIIVNITLKVCESIMRFVSPLTHFQKVTQQYEKIGETGIIDGILQKLQDYCVFDESMEVQNNQIQQTVQKSLSKATVQYILKILTLCGRYSINLTKMITAFDIFKLVETFLPSKEDFQKIHFTQDKFPFIIESISLLDSLLPDREEQLKGDNDKARLVIEKEKGIFYMTQQQGQLIFLAEKLLPKMFYVYENNIQSQIRTKTLQIIDKMISLFNNELLNNFIEPYSFAKFIYSNLRTNNIQSLLLCVSMVDKLMKSNPKTYILPLMREGVTSYIKKISTQDDFEKTLNLKMSEVSADQTDKSEDFLAKARIAVLKKGECQDKEAQQQFEQTIQKYLEESRIQQLVQAQPSKSQIENANQIIQVSAHLMTDYFENEEFLAKLNEWYGEEFKLINMLKNLARDIVQEAKQEAFNFEKTKNLLKQVAECLTSKRQIMNYEFKESGLLEALELFLTHSPKQVQLIREKEKLGEEIKHSEEMQMSQMVKGSQQISKKEARSYIQRLKTFTHIMLSTFNEKKPIQELINLCHELLSQSEYQIFENQTSQDPNNPAANSAYGNLFAHNYEDPNQSVTALRQLTRRIRVNLVYDPTKSFLKKNESNQSPKFPETLLKPSEISLQKASSHHPAFAHLGDRPATKEEVHSKVFLKRNFLYTELSQVLISVEQCASLWLLEDFLRNKIRTAEDVKTLKTPQSFYSGLKKSTTQTSPKAREILERGMERMREIMESGSSKEQIREDGDQFAESFSQELIDTVELSEQEQVEIIKLLEIQILQMMDEFYSEQEGQYDEAMRDDILDVDDDLNIEQKIFEFQRVIETMRLLYRQKKQSQKEEQLIAKPKTKSSVLQSTSTSQIDTEMKLTTEQTHNSLEQQLKQLKQVIDSPEDEEEKKNEEEAKREDVDMTDEEEEEQKKMIEFLEKKRHQMQMKSQTEIELSVEDSSQNPIKDSINMDLDELIKAVGDDIEFEFYYNDQLVNQNQTIFEILKSGESRQILKDTSHLFGGHYGQGSKAETTGNFYFLIKDKRDDLTMQRKDSLLEFSAKRERTKSEAVEDISVSAVNQIAQQLIDKEFQVFSKDILKEIKIKDKDNQLKQLDQSLKILKVLNFICKNIQLLSNQGIKFIINQYDEEEQKDEMFQDISLQIGVSQLHSNVFHHHKLDSFILKNIQDPYALIGGGISETLQQIFRNCPFLFPFQTRQLFFKLISFIGSIDMNRSIYFLRQFLKQKLGKLPTEDKNTTVKFQKQKVTVDRNRIIDSSFSLMKQINKRAFLEIQYKEEAGTGLGPTLEFYYLVSKEIRTIDIPQNGQKKNIWRKGMIDNSLFPGPISIHQLKTEELQKLYEIFRLTGMMIAKSVSDDRLIDLPISSLFWDLVLGKQGARVEDLGFSFTLPGFENIELRQNGKQIDVTLENLQEYVDLVMHYIFHESIKIQLQAFKKGFNSIFPVDTLKPFSTLYELEDMICGVQRNDEEWTNIARLLENVVPAHGYHSKSKEYLELLRFISELDHGERRKFLTFVTGSPRLPNGGFASLDPKLTVVLKKPVNVQFESPDDILPSVMTCQNYIKLPSYSSFERLKMKFEMAYNEGTNNFTLS